MDKNFKRRALISIIIGFFGQTALLMYLTKIYTVSGWELIAGSSLFVVGTLILFNLFSVKKTIFKEKVLLFYAVVLNPSLVSVFSGIGILTMNYSRLDYIAIPAGIAMVLSIIIGFVMLIVFLIRKDKTLHSTSPS